MFLYRASAIAMSPVVLQRALASGRTFFSSSVQSVHNTGSALHSKSGEIVNHYFQAIGAK